MNGRERTANRHRWSNRIQTLLLVLALIAISTLAGGLVFGEQGFWIALGASALALLLEPAAASALTLRLYGARPIRLEEAPGLWRVLQQLASRAGLPAVPVPYYIPSAVVNAFATGSKRRAAIALTDGLLRSLTPRELVAVVGHEVAHIANDDLRVMGLADYVSRLTSLLALAGQVGVVVSLPLVLTGGAEINLLGLLVLVAAPHLALLAQLGLSRVREFDADRRGAQLTGDPQGLASALAKIERVERSWRAWLVPGWGNPEPSWLRTHPHTSERIARLLQLAAEAPQRPTLASSAAAEWPAAALRSPRWYPGGFWR